MAKEEEVARLWTKEAVLDVENKILQQIMSARTGEGSEASVALRAVPAGCRGSTPTTTLCFSRCSRSRTTGCWMRSSATVIRSSSSRPFLPNEYLVVEVLPAPHAVALRAGSTPRRSPSCSACSRTPTARPATATRSTSLSVADVDNLGKHLEKEKGQNDPRNRCILDILDRIGSLEGLRWDESMEQVARQAHKIRSNFFDNTKALEDCIPQVLLVRGDYRQEEVAPRQLFAD